MDRTWKFLIIAFLLVVASIVLELVVPIFFRVPPKILGGFSNMTLGVLVIVVTEIAIRSKMISKARWLTRITAVVFFLLNLHATLWPSIYIDSSPSPLKVVKYVLTGLIMICYAAAVVVHSTKQKNNSLGIKTP
jgi:hypothetical protein